MGAGPGPPGGAHPAEALAGTLRAAGGLVAWVVPAKAEPTPRPREFYGDVRPTSEVLDLIG